MPYNATICIITWGMSLNFKMYSWFGINWTQIGNILSPGLTHVYQTFLTMVNMNGKQHTLLVCPSIYGFWLPLLHLQTTVIRTARILKILLHLLYSCMVYKKVEVLLELLIKPIVRIKMCGTRLDGSTMQIIYRILELM